MDANFSNHLTFQAHYGEPSDSLLIFGENLRVLKRLEHQFLGKIQCIYLDPPYNTCNSFSMLNDSLPQNKWESTMRERLQVLWPFLSDTGSIWMSIDDSEFADLKVLCDKIWGREHFVVCIVRQKNKYPSNPERTVVHMHDYILVYAKNPKNVKIRETAHGFNANNSPDSSSLQNLLIWSSSLKSGESITEHIYKISTPDGSVISPPKDRCWSVTHKQYDQLKADGLIWFDDKSVFPYLKKSNDRPVSMWMEDEVGSNQEARFEIRNYDFGSFFYVPKPERLLFKILSICTDAGDWVLDPYLGSGTTAVVAKKMSRKWIGIEQGEEQFFNICIPRLNDVIKGSEKSAVTEIVNWHGGGGFSFFSLTDV